MNKDIQQKLFNYFHQEHKIMLLDGDYNEIEHILRSKLSSVLTNEEIEAEAEKIDAGPDDSGLTIYELTERKIGFVEGAKFYRDKPKIKKKL